MLHPVFQDSQHTLLHLEEFVLFEMYMTVASPDTWVRYVS